MAPESTPRRRGGKHERPMPRRLTAILAACAGAAALTCATAGPAAAVAPALVTNPASLVNPFIGTTNSSDDFPGADSPFGMVQWSPDTPSRPDGGGYEYNDSAITGFSLTHISGPGCGAAGDVPVLPTVGAVNTSATDSFSHSNETASPGYYSVALANGVTTQLTTTTRSGMAQFTFPSTTQANLIFKLNGSQNGDSNTQFNVVSSTEVSGQVTSGGFCGATNSYTVYFDMVFNTPFTTNGTQAVPATLKAPATTGASDSAAEAPNKPTLHGTLPPAAHKGTAAVTPQATVNDGYVTFNTTGNPVVLAKVGISYVSAANAVTNRTTENPNWNFAGTQSAAQSAWNTLLGKVDVGGGTASDQAVFYTALYHSLLHPNVISDVNGQYPGFNGTVHTVDSGHSAVYANYSGWDIYRSQAQLEALVDPTVASDTAQSMVDDYTQTGLFPKWSEDNGETYVMVGDPADEILADYYAFGAANFNASAALSGLISEATNPNNDRPGLNYLAAPGFLPADGTYGCCNPYGPESTTLEYDASDFALSALAGDLGDTADQTAFADRAQEWRNVLNPNSGYDQPRDDDSWPIGFDPTSGNDFVEADSFIYTGMVPFDLSGLTAAKGGDTAMNHYLGTVLRSFTGADGYAWVGNEPSIELPWEYDYTGEPYQTQATVRAIQQQIWTDTPAGLADGNDDLGEMSSWYVWSALGMYPETPGTATLALGSPLFTQAVITLPSGNTLTVNGNGAADGAPYVQSATWNGAAWNDAYAPTSAITSGGTLTYTLGTSANTSWAAAANEAPPSYGGNTVAPPSPRVGPITAGVGSDLCLDDQSSSVTDGNPVQIYGCDQTAAQDWTIGTDGTIRTLGKCLDVAGGATATHTLVDLYGCNTTGAQQWRIGPNGELVNPQSGLCLDDTNVSTTPGTQLQIYTCDDNAAQDWTLPPAPTDPTGPVTAGVGDNLCLDDNQAATANGTHIQLYTCDNTPAQNWTLEPDGTLQVLGSCMDATQGATTSGTLIQLYTCNQTSAQQWRATTAGQLVNTHSGLCLDDPNATTASGTQLQLYTCDNTPAQVWHLTA